jgi:hypothetical protein
MICQPVHRAPRYSAIFSRNFIFISNLCDFRHTSMLKFPQMVVASHPVKVVTTVKVSFPPAVIPVFQTHLCHTKIVGWVTEKKAT